jgi:hypothetical protein
MVMGLLLYIIGSLMERHGHRPRLRSQRRQTTNAAISTVTAMIASDQRRRRQFTPVPLVMTEAYAYR